MAWMSPVVQVDGKQRPSLGAMDVKIAFGEGFFNLINSQKLLPGRLRLDKQYLPVKRADVADSPLGSIWGAKVWVHSE